MRVLVTLTFGLLVGLFLSIPGLAEDTKPVPFADFDGDGINDNIDDSDADGIPDNADPDYEIVEPAADQEENAFDFGETINAMGLAADIATNSEKFGQREFYCRGLTSNRCGFTSEEGFGSEGLGVDVGGGGGCAGGVCR